MAGLGRRTVSLEEMRSRNTEIRTREEHLYDYWHNVSVNLLDDN